MKPSLSRRRFLSLTSAALAGASMFDVARLARAEDDRFGGLPIGIQSYTLRKFDVREAVRHADGLDLRYMEFFSGHFSPKSTAEEIRDFNSLLFQSELSMNAHGVNSFTEDHEENRKLFKFAKAAGFRNLTANPTSESFHSLDKLCEEYDVRICIHNHGPGALYDKLSDVQKAVKDHHPNIGACIDTGHVLRSDEDPVKWIRELGPRVFALHIKDVAERQKRTHDVVIGTAHLDLVGVFQALKEIKFPADGSLSLEYEANPDNPIDDVKQCLAAAEKAIAKVQA